MLCLNLGIEALSENIGRWETTWFNFRMLHLICFNLVGYDLYQCVCVLCLCLCVGVLVCV